MESPECQAGVSHRAKFHAPNSKEKRMSNEPLDALAFSSNGYVRAAFLSLLPILW
jgi:hypothetical protein